MSLSKLQGEVVRVVTFANQNVLIAALSNFNRQSQDFLLCRRVLVGGGRGPSRRTLVVLADGSGVVQVREIVILEIIQITWQAQ